jgi:hypothetical protein
MHCGSWQIALFYWSIQGQIMRLLQNPNEIIMVGGID